jgi:hypothetical protein
MSFVVSATVVTDNEDQVAKAAEVFARAITGLALDGISVAVHIGTADEGEETTK